MTPFPQKQSGELHKSNIQGTGTIAKHLITESNAKSDRDGVMIIKPGLLLI
jgi:hypothetical protein